MLYIRELFKQDLRDGKQIAFPKEPSISFFDFDYPNKAEDRQIVFTFVSDSDKFSSLNGKRIETRLYAAGSESRIDGQLKAFLRDELNAQVGDLVIFTHADKDNIEYEFKFISQKVELYSAIRLLLAGKKHAVAQTDIADDGKKETNTPNSFHSSNLQEFWNHVGQTVLAVDDDFSKLPIYYHKGHIRVRTNYGGASNFAVGFYDAESGRVNKDVSFIYKGYTDSDGEHTFYLNLDIPREKAFEYFIPVFNNTYQGLFEISSDGTTYFFRDLREAPFEPYKSNKCRQVIYFGAPGTGKSHAVNGVVKKEAPNRNIRTTFHPDTDYSSFVGCFKPTMNDGKIEYAFTAQAFIKAYIGAWSDLSKPFYLVIEEINRGNCAQIFGDIFQLLDRNENGESSYGIRPDSDLQKYISDKLGLLTNIPEEIRSGEEMRFPANFFIYATMNTSDQSLFPIDSAFKRRWDWRYTAIKPGEKDHILVVGVHRYNWTSFISKVNSKIYDLTKSEDKQIGYWFIKPDENGEIDWRRFVSKAIFYIWNDIVKDYATMEKENSAFGKKFSFTTFFDKDGNPLIEQTIAFLDTLNVDKLSATSSVQSDAPLNDDADDDTDGDDMNDIGDNPLHFSGSKYSYTLNGTPYTGIGKAIIEIVNTLGRHFSFDEIAESFSRIVKKTYKKGAAIRAQHPSELNPDENGRNRWYVNPFHDKDGKEFSLISLWPDSYYPRIKEWVENYPELFPQGFIQNEAAD